MTYDRLGGDPLRPPEDRFYAEPPYNPPEREMPSELGFRAGVAVGFLAGFVLALLWGLSGGR